MSTAVLVKFIVTKMLTYLKGKRQMTVSAARNIDGNNRSTSSGF